MWKLFFFNLVHPEPVLAASAIIGGLVASSWTASISIGAFAAFSWTKEKTR